MLKTNPEDTRSLLNTEEKLKEYFGSFSISFDIFNHGMVFLFGGAIRDAFHVMQTCKDLDFICAQKDFKAIYDYLLSNGYEDKGLTPSLKNKQVKGTKFMNKNSKTVDVMYCLCEHEYANDFYIIINEMCNVDMSYSGIMYNPHMFFIEIVKNAFEHLKRKILKTRLKLDDQTCIEEDLYLKIEILKNEGWFLLE